MDTKLALGVGLVVGYGASKYFSRNAVLDEEQTTSPAEQEEIKSDGRRVSRLVRFRDASGVERLGDDKGNGKAEVLIGDVFGDYCLTGEEMEIVTRLSPCPIPPPSVLCVGLNYRAHAAEADWGTAPANPILFMKNQSAVCGPNDAIILPKVCEETPQVDYETELCIVIGKPAKNVPLEEALDYVLGYCVGNDVSARDWQRNKSLGGGQWVRGKGFDTFAPIGPVLVMADQIDPDNLQISSELNGKVMQNSNTSFMIHSVASLIHFMSQDTTLLPGTVIMTGTPEGVGFVRDPPVFLQPGDTIVCKIEGIGAVENKVIAASNL